MGERAVVRIAESGDGGWLHRVMGGQVSLQILAADHRDSAGRHGRQSRHRGVPDWTPLQLTYPMPDHDSGHAVQGGVAAEILKQVFGTDDIAFTACSTTVGPGHGLHRPNAGAPFVLELLAGSRRERRVADLHRHSLPERRRGRRSTRPQDRRAGRPPVPQARPLTGSVNRAAHDATRPMSRVLVACAALPHLTTERRYAADHTALVLMKYFGSDAVRTRPPRVD